jgi:cell division protein FtsB
MAKIKLRFSFIIAVIVLGILFLPGYAKFMELKSRNDYLEQEISRLEMENVKLYKEKSKLENDMDYIEKVARESMGLTKEGEMPIKIEWESQ